MALTAAERRAKIRARLREAEEPPGTVEETTNTMTEEIPEEESQPVVQKHQVTVPKPGVPRAATSPRSRKPPNYKIHVLTALGLALAIRFARYGTKAVTG
jgi:hypothetical protein